MKRRNFKIVAQVRARRRQRQARTRRLRLATLSREVMERKMVLIVEVVIQFYDAVIAVARAWHGREIVARCCRQAGNRAWPKAGKQRIGYRAFRYTIRGELISR